MEITLKTITVKELVDGYVDKGNEGVVAYGGKLDVRPPFQREFVYDKQKEQAVIDSIAKGYPINTMYWSQKDDDTYEIIDGQQRTLSICHFYDHKFAYMDDKNKENMIQYYNNFSTNEKNRIDNYKLTIYVCKGSSEEKFQWFNIINTVGVPLTKQELLNAAYTGTWLTSAKEYFSNKKNPSGARRYAKYLSGDMNRQKYLETAIKWASNNSIETYMNRHKNDPNADELWHNFKRKIEWFTSIFKDYDNTMKGLDINKLYQDYYTNEYYPEEVKQQVDKLMKDPEVKNKKGIYEYVLTYGQEEKHLNLRTFSKNQKITMYKRQHGICPMCGNEFDIKDMHADHVLAWSKGGTTTIDNGQMLCRQCNLRKGAK